MKLPNGEHAFVDIVKLTGYCLNSEHPLERITCKSNTKKIAYASGASISNSC